jgi:tetrathionate reductase subunit A
MKKTAQKPSGCKLTRRDFLKVSSASAGCAAAFLGANPIVHKVLAGRYTTPDGYPLKLPENILYSVCLQCHTACTIKAKILDGVMVKVDGNPYSPMNLLPQIAYDVPPSEAALIDGRLCPKGQSAVQSQYDPYRIVRVLKRTGPRGSNQWEIIPFERAIDEIVGGGSFRDGTSTPGLKDIRAVEDPGTMSALKADSAAVASGKMSLDVFKSKHAAHLDLLIEPDLPDLGTKNNQFAFIAGRIEHGRKEFSKRWLKDAFGSVNWWEHTTICEQSHHIAYKEMTNQCKAGKWSGGKTHMKPDFINSEFVIFFGTGAFEANFGPTPMTELVTDGIVHGNLKIAVVDPRLSKTASKAEWWLPIEPGTDAALALGMIRYILDNHRYDARYLANANKAAAHADDETTWSNAAHLVKLENGKPTNLLRAGDVGVEAPKGMDPAHCFVVSKAGELVAFDPNDGGHPEEGDLFVKGSANGVEYKSAMLLLREVATERTLEEWAEICRVPSRKIIQVAKEFTAHGKKAAAELYRGAVQHTNGYYNAQAIITLNVLIGNGDWNGGLTAGGGHWHEFGNKAHFPFDLLDAKMHPGKLGSFGTILTREKSAYEESMLFRKEGYPAKRPWFPYTSNVYQEIIPSAGDGYPYPIKALFLHMGTPVYASPAGNPSIDILRDAKKIPLFFACDIVIGETSMYADYLFPDAAIWERWGLPHITPAVLTRVSKVRQPVVSPLVEMVTVYGEEQPTSMEAIMLAIAERLELPGYGPDGLGKGVALTRSEDWFLKGAANIAYGDKSGGKDQVEPASEEEMALFRRARRHIGTFDEARWKQAVGNDEDLWRRMVTVLNRGGRFEDFGKRHKGEKVGHSWGKMFSIYVENVARGRHSFTGECFSGLPFYQPVLDAAGRPVRDPEEYDLKLFTFKEITGGQSRTAGNYWMQDAILPENFVTINSTDARRLALRDGDPVRVTSASNPEGVWRLGNGKDKPVAGKLKVSEGVMPGTVGVCWHYGHWAYGAADVTINGEVVPGDPRRGRGLCTNAVLREDPALKNVCLEDPIGGSASFFDTMVKVEKHVS